MKNFICIFFILFCMRFHAQINNVFGLSFGYGNLDNYGALSYPKELNYKFETNLNYCFNYKLLIVKAEYGFIPSNNFGTIHRFFISPGISSNLERKISFHFLTGFGGYKFIKSYLTTEGKELVHSTKTYLLLNTGILLKPFEKIKIAFGMDLSLTGMTLTSTESKGKFTTYTYNYSPLILSGSINYFLPNKTKSKKTN